MELVITETIHNQHGEVKLAAGEVKNYPGHTWKQIAKSAGLRLSEFTDSVDAVAASALGGKSSRKSRSRGRKRAKLSS